MLRDAGASEVHVRVACPAITDPCYMGVDMAAREDLIAANMDVESIAEHIGADSLAFLSIEALMRGLEAQEGTATPVSPASTRSRKSASSS